MGRRDREKKEVREIGKGGGKGSHTYILVAKLETGIGQAPLGAPVGAEPGDHSPIIREAVESASPSPLPKVLGGTLLQDWLDNVGKERLGVMTS